MISGELDKLLQTKKILCFDFDGVIKDSNDVKKNAFVDLFDNASSVLKRQIATHHTEHLGTSRYIKIPYYMRLASLELSPEKISIYESRFSEIVTRKVIDSRWVPGAHEFIARCSVTHSLYIISATPQKELDFIVHELSLDRFFQSAYGSPTSKEEAIKDILRLTGSTQSDALFFGDGLTDLRAAKNTGLSFILVCNSQNMSVQDLVPASSRIQNFL